MNDNFLIYIESSTGNVTRLYPTYMSVTGYSVNNFKKDRPWEIRKDSSVWEERT